MKVSALLVFIAAGLLQVTSFSAEDEETDWNDYTDPERPVKFRQVQMHVWISETNEKGLRDIGTNLNYTRFADNSDDNLQQVTTSLFDPLNPLFNVTLPAPSQTNFNEPLRPDRDDSIVGIQTQSGAGLTFSLIESNHGQIDGVIRMIQQNNDVDLISKPEILVIENLPAEIKAGGKVPYQDLEYDSKGVPRLNVAFKDVGVSMRITPTIRSDNLIMLDIEQLEVTDISRVDNIRGVDLPVFARRSQTGIVLVPDGQALVIGGLSSRVTRRTERRGPILGKIPVVGILFRGRQSEIHKTHLMIFVSPTVVDLREMTPAAVSALDFWKNGSWTNESAIADEMRLMETER